MAFDNKVSAELAPVAIQEILDALETIRVRLPFVVALTKDERKELFKLGPASVHFAALIHQYAQAHPALVSEVVDLPEFEKDVRLMQALDQFRSVLSGLARTVEDTRTVVGAEAMSAALLAYGIFKTAEKTVPELTEMLEEAGARFKRGRTRTPPAPEGE